SATPKRPRSTSRKALRASIPRVPTPPALSWRRSRSSCWWEWTSSASTSKVVGRIAMTIASRSSTRVFRSIHPRSKSGPVAGHSWLTIQAATKESTVGIEVSNLSKRYGAFQAIKDVSFEVIAGQLVALLGPSGSGKSTILRIIAGLEVADTGGVVLTGEDATRLPVQERGVGFVFQHYALFRHMTVRNNIAFGLKVRKLPKSEIRARVDELLELVQLTGYAG